MASYPYRSKAKDKDQQAEILLEEDGMAIAQRGTHYFLLYIPQKKNQNKNVICELRKKMHGKLYSMYAEYRIFMKNMC